MDNTVFIIESMNNTTSKNIIKKALTQLNGVQSVKTNLDKRAAYVNFDSMVTSPDKMKDAIENSRYDVT